MSVIYKLDSLGFYSGEVQLDESYPIELTTRIAPPPHPWPSGHLANFNILTNSWRLVDCSPDPTNAQVVKPHVEIIGHEIDLAEGHYHDTSLAGCTVPVGSVVIFKTKITYGVGGPILPISDVFRLPLVSSDGRERIVLANYTDGYADIRIPLKESGVWSVTQEQINKKLPQERQMTFDGAVIYSYEV